MSDLIFSVNVTIPIFLVMVVGYFLRRIGMLNDSFVAAANKFNFKVTLPVMLFRDLSTVDIQDVFDVKFVLFCAIATSICFWGVWGLAKIFMKDDWGFYSGIFQKQCGRHGAGVHTEHIRFGHHGFSDDHRSGSAVQYIFGDRAHV